MRFELFDTHGKCRVIDSKLSIHEMRQYLSEFKTHCAVEQTPYEFNHFKNWLMKYYNTELVYVESTPIRVDM
jgi:hypothetical protein